MEFILKDKPFAIERAELSATVPDPYWLRKYHPTGDSRLFWCLEVEAEGEVDEDVLTPFAAVEEMRFPIRRWTDLAGQFIEWSGPADEKAGVPNGRFYLEDHGRISRARLRFTEQDGVRLRFEWEGLCDVHWPYEFEQDVPFSATGWANFRGVAVFGSASDTEESLRSRLGENIDSRDFVPGQLVPGPRYDSGVKMCSMVFTPWEQSNEPIDELRY